MLIGTETPSVLKEAIQWGYKNNWTIVYNPIQIEIFKNKSTYTGIDITRNINASHDIDSISISNGTEASLKTSLKDMYLNQILNVNATNNFFKISTKLEYLSMIVNLSDLMKCSIGFVCTLASNYCRILDEFRAILAMKGHVDFADISLETCSKPPCVGNEHIKSFSW